MKTLFSLFILLSLTVLGQCTYDSKSGGKEDLEHGGKTMDNDFEESEKMEEKKPLFTKQWRAIYSRNQLNLQAAWTLESGQPDDDSYQVRRYLAHWRAVSHTPCDKQSTAASSGYINLYFYFNGFNYQKKKYPLTYPAVLMSKIKPPKTTVVVPTPEPETDDETHRMKRAAKKSVKGKKGKKWKGKKGKRGKKRRRKPTLKCDETYSYIFYVPIPLKQWAAKTADKSIKTVRTKEQVMFVRAYAGNSTEAYCNEQKELLQMSLVKNNETFQENLWFCAKYAPGENAKEAVQTYEVWMKKQMN